MMRAYDGELCQLDWTVEVKIAGKTFLNVFVKVFLEEINI